ncbi:CoA synthetase [Tianweitania sp. BSSL-BM11]|uniref:CoA synthetase n=1 Tax=Tianweitania aestuarii TaxID=2814886 RepID=A0ABS5RYI2_9HYPH|nr:CoA transferase [Tianweitania aestuarii]MBS9721381.1 CoA synthetase [Tianweitania aestuarii]
MSGASPILPREILIATVARLLDGVRHVAVGASSPIPAAGAMLLRALKQQAGEKPVRISILGSVEHNFFTNGSAELFDCAGQGRIDAFFLGGGQIDGQGNVNLVGAGAYPQSSVRWPGSFGSAYLYFVVPRVILFREEHSPRVFVNKVDFISAPGTSAEGVYRRGGPHALLTSKGLFRFNKTQGNFALDSVHPGHDLAEIKDATGFRFDHPARPEQTPEPDARTLSLLRGQVMDELSETYPDFAKQMRDDLQALQDPQAAIAS